MLRTDSRKVEKGDTFIAIKNVNTDGHDFIESAINNGATKIICEHGSYSVETQIVPDTRKYLEDYLYNNYYPKFKDMKLIGVTGTNGKTTICYLVYQLLNKLGKKCAYIGTIGFYYEGHKEELNNTTPDVDLLYKMFLEAKENNCEALVMEVSSHALDMNRIHGLEFDEVAFTNLTQDHLDYHKTFENYIAAKRKLFYKTRGDKIAVINGDDSTYKEFINPDNNNVIISKDNGDVNILDVKLSHLGTNIKFSYLNKEYEVNINMVGSYNVYNYLTALVLVNKMGYNIEDIITITNEISAPSGRMELIKYKTNSIFIDYAHTPDAVTNVLKNVTKFKKGKIITIIGCGGDRDRTKRPIMADETLKYSDYAIFTNDNPRTEDEKQIMNDITGHLTGNNYEVIYDRGEAIKKAFSMLGENDILMVLGKGHENYQIIGTEKVHFSDKEEVLKCINEN
ncbi:MAG: UDP-N-acetylmuramoyl-L-alanyl-D-glutamate--2,6-diaminopimelate ligase [Bacilli bacterium]|nr:UDP-N-acetylmuramoyl-L-alanyl-D-glutamate--2,6-diaminopimelate ligase [Bacilli bacterium]